MQLYIIVVAIVGGFTAHGKKHSKEHAEYEWPHDTGVVFLRVMFCPYYFLHDYQVHGKADVHPALLSDRDRDHG